MSPQKKHKDITLADLRMSPAEMKMFAEGSRRWVGQADWEQETLPLEELEDKTETE